MTLFQRILTGFFSPLQGLILIFSNPRYLFYASLPLLIGVGLVFLSYFLVSDFLSSWVYDWVGGIAFFQDWTYLAGVASFIMLVLGWALLSLVNFLLGYLCISVVAGPFYSLLVESIFSREVPGLALRSSGSVALKMLCLSFLKIGLFLCVGIICFVMTFFPPLNFLSALVLMLMVAFDCSDYAFEVSRLNLRGRFEFFRKHFWEYLGLSLAIFVTSLLPGAFFILLPIFICGATKMYIQQSYKTV